MVFNTSAYVDWKSRKVPWWQNPANTGQGGIGSECWGKRFSGAVCVEIPAQSARAGTRLLILLSVQWDLTQSSNSLKSQIHLHMFIHTSLWYFIHFLFLLKAWILSCSCNADFGEAGCWYSIPVIWWHSFLSPCGRGTSVWERAIQCSWLSQQLSQLHAYSLRRVLLPEMANSGKEM